MTRAGTNLFGGDRLSCQTFNLQFCCDIPTYQNKLLAVAWEMLQEELNIIEDGEGLIPDIFAGTRKDIARHTFSRGNSFIRARVGEEDGRGEEQQNMSRGWK